MSIVVKYLVRFSIMGTCIAQAISIAHTGLMLGQMGPLSMEANELLYRHYIFTIATSFVLLVTGIFMFDELISRKTKGKGKGRERVRSLIN